MYYRIFFLFLVVFLLFSFFSYLPLRRKDASFVGFSYMYVRASGKMATITKSVCFVNRRSLRMWVTSLLLFCFSASILACVTGSKRWPSAATLKRPLHLLIKKKKKKRNVKLVREDLLFYALHREVLASFTCISFFFFVYLHKLLFLLGFVFLFFFLLLRALTLFFFFFSRGV